MKLRSKMAPTKKNKKSPVELKIVGLILSESYQRSKIFVKKVYKHYKENFLNPSIKGLLEIDWLEYLTRLQKGVGGQTLAIKHGVVVFINAVFIGGENELFERFKFVEYRSPGLEVIREQARQEYLRYLNCRNLIYSYMELTLDDEYMGTLLFELRPDLLPNTATWFAILCDDKNSMGYSYQGSRVHRVCKSGWFQAGILKSHSLKNKFLQDESLCYKHDRRGILSFANDGPDTNQSQFFVTFQAAQWMDEYYVAFGRVVEGSEVLRRIEYTPCTYEYPDRTIFISKCGMADVGLGRSLGLVNKIRIRGITQGDLHIDPEMFVSLILDWFCDVLFERLDDEIKRALQGEWIAEVLWDRVQQQLRVRWPEKDVPDIKDRSSHVFLAGRYLAGLYGLSDIPDHYIQKLLYRVVSDAVECSDTADMARSIVRFILDTVQNIIFTPQDSSTEQEMAELLSILLDNVNRTVFGSQPSESTFNASRVEHIARTVAKTVSERRTLSLRDQIRSTQSEPQTKITPSEEQSIEKSLKPSEYVLNTGSTASLSKYIWETLLSSLQKQICNDN